MQDLGSTGTMERSLHLVASYLVFLLNTSGFNAISLWLFDSSDQFLVFDFRANGFWVRLRYDPRGASGLVGPKYVAQTFYSWMRNVSRVYIIALY